jgi:hypothetical protein
MSAPNDSGRLGEMWNETRMAIILQEISAIRDYVVISGGWAWHFMTPPGHTEFKHAHDHRDADLFVAPKDVASLLTLLKNRGYEKTWTRFDRMPSSQAFSRHTKHVRTRDEIVKVMLDLFVAEVPFVEIQGFKVVEPKYLLSLYGTLHGSDKCFSVRIAKRLIAAGINPVGRSEMVDYREFLHSSN